MQANSVKFLVIGLGSMGRRRIRNLLFHGVSPERIFGFNSSESRSRDIEKEYGIKTFSTFLEADAISPDVYIICTPPLSHHEYFLRAARKKKHFFVEVTTENTGYDELKPLLDGSFVAAPSCTFRYVPAVQRIKELLQSGAIGAPLCFQHYLGQYLPDWHPYEDYRTVYFAKKETGGCKEMFPYELVWLSDIFQSSVKSVRGARGRISALEMTADDVYAAFVQFENGVVGNMLVDILNRKACRTVKIIGTRGTLDWDWLGKTLVVYDAEKHVSEITDVREGKKVGQYNTGEEAYEAEMKDFLLAIQGEKAFPYTFQEDEAMLRSVNDFVDIQK